jgi:hypothetical protein
MPNTKNKLILLRMPFTYWRFFLKQSLPGDQNFWRILPEEEPKLIIINRELK